MTTSVPRRLPEVKSLWDILPKGTEGGREFARLTDLLLFHEARRSGGRTLLFSDAAGDYGGLDSASEGLLRHEGTTGYQYKFYPSPLSTEHRDSIESSLVRVTEAHSKNAFTKWILVTPTDFVESSTRKSGGDVTWFEGLKKKLNLQFSIEHWGHKQILALLLDTPALCIFYYPELVDADQTRRRTIADTRERYNVGLHTLYRDIQFVGMSVYKAEATKGIAIQEIYIPLTLVSETASPDDTDGRRNPLDLLVEGSRHVILGDPGSGKSTLIRFLTLAGLSRALQSRYQAKPDNRLPAVVILRRYADALKQRPALSLLDYIIESIQADFSLKSADAVFFEHYLESGRTILFLDGLDELPTPHFKETVRDRIRTLVATYPGNTVIVTSRIVGYEEPFRFDADEFTHHRIAPLRLPEIERFVHDWYRIRLENKAERERNVSDLLQIVKDETHMAIQQLASNPLLLTIVTLVHRIDAVLPDERVVLYQKCTETLLNTWHTWKNRETEPKNRGRVERRNRARMEAIAYWMQSSGSGTGRGARAVVSYNDLLAFVAQHIEVNERIRERELEAQDAAVEFLAFVKDRAGLLIEVGDRQFSFVHLTFQEYLAAMYIATTNEAGGVEAMWRCIGAHCVDDRWHEVIRLLIGGLRSPVTQRALVNELLASPAAHAIAGVELLGGLILDGIDAAEERADKIAQCLVDAAIMTADQEECRRIVRIIKAWRRRETFDENVVTTALSQSVAAKSFLKERALLLAPALGVEANWLGRWSVLRDVPEHARYAVAVLCGTAAETTPPATFVERLHYCVDIQALCAVTSSQTNRVAAATQLYLCGLPRALGAAMLFRVLLTSLMVGGADGGPFLEFPANTLWIADGTIPHDVVPERERRRAGGPPRAEGRILTEAVSILAGSPWHGREVLHRRIKRLAGSNDPIEAVLGSISRTLAPLSVAEAANSVEGDGRLTSGIFTHVAAILGRLIDEDGRSQWSCAISERLRAVGANAFWMLDPQTLRGSLLALASGSADSYHGFIVGWHLIFECWAHLYRIQRPLLDEVWKDLRAISPTQPHPAVKIGRVINDLAHDRPVPVESLIEDDDCAALLQQSGRSTKGGGRRPRSRIRRPGSRKRSGRA